MSKFLDIDVLNYAISNLTRQIDKTFLKKKVLFNVTPAYYRLFNSATDNPSDKLTVIANNLTPSTGQVTSDTVRFITKNPSVYAVGAEVVFVEEVMTPKFDNIIGLTEQELTDIKALTSTDRQNKYFSNILFVVDDTKLVFYDKTLDTFTDCTSGAINYPQWETDHDYIVGDKVKHNNYVYECIIAHHSDLIDFDNDKDNWIIELDKYYNLTKNQYDLLVANGTIDSTNKHLYVVEGDSSGGSSNLTTDLISNVDVGGVSANTKYTKGTSLETIIKDILVKYFPADLVFSLNPSKTLYKIGEVVNSIDLIATVTKKSNNIENIKYYIDGVLVNTKDETTNTGIGNGGTYTYTYSTPFSTDTTFKVDVYDGKNTTTKTIKVEFVNPFYCGLASGTLQEIVQKKGAYTYNNITCNNDSIVFKYPKSYGTLTSILDSNNFENISAFSRNEEVINSVDYYVYTSAVTTVSNFKFIFKF